MKKILFITALCSFLLCLLGGYYLTLWMGERDHQMETAQVDQMTQSIPTINSSTKMVYQYFYSRDKVTKEQIEAAPLYLQGMNMEQLKEIVSSVSIPVVAIGGISADNILQLRGSGVDGVAVVSAIFAADDPGKATADLLKLAEEMVASHG